MDQNTLMSLAYFGFFIALVYFFMIRPVRKEQNRRKEMFDRLKVNDWVVTQGGIHGVVTKIGENTVILRIADDVKVEFNKEAIAFINDKK